MNIDRNKIKEYLLRELKNVKTPKTNLLIQIDDLDFKIDLLFDLLKFRINYTDLDRIEDNFFNSLNPTLVNNDISNLESSFENLAANIEAFLKKIAYLKYSNTYYWEGNDEIKGLKKTMFARLCNGTIEPIKKGVFKIPEPLIDYNEPNKEIFDFVRDEIRNSLHNAKRYSKSDFFYFLNLVLVCYLKAIEDNLHFLKTKVLPEYIYLENIINERLYFDIDKVYIDLLGKELEDIEMMGIEIADERKLLNNIDNYSLIFEDEDDEDLMKNLEELRIDSILNIAEDTPNLIIIGPAGTGKTSTLHKILFNNSKKIYEGNNTLKIPFYLAANEYGSNRTFRSILNSKINEEWINESLDIGKIQLLIDGINEVHNDYKYLVVKEIADLKKSYPNISIVITDRKFGFENFLDYPVFELKELTIVQIKEFTYKYLINNDLEQVWKDLSSNENMLLLGKNPLMLKMILSVIKENSIPKNRGQLYQLFIKTIFLREEQKKKQIDRDIKTNLLSEIAFKMRSLGSVSISESNFKNIIKEVIENFKVSISSIQFYKEILDNYIIKKSINSEVSFLHETYQEFFCAFYLNDFFEINNETKIDLGDSKWIEPLLICGELIKEEENKISYFKYLYRGQEKANNVKSFSEFNSDDLNKNIFVACSYAQKNKTEENDIYKLCEIYLSNYLVLLKKGYLNNHQWFIPLENLFASISILNSEKILRKIFLDIEWVEIWLYNSENNLFNTLSKELINNSKNLNEILKIIKISIDENNWIPKVIENLKQLKNNLLQNSTVDNLIQYYNIDNDDDDILISIIQKDPKYLNNYSFENNENKRNIKVLRTLIKNHHKNENCRAIFINEIRSRTYNLRFLKYFINLFYNFGYYKEFIEIMEYFYDTSYYLYEENIEKLQSLPITFLSKKLKDSFIQNPISNSIPICSIENNNQFLIETCYYNFVNNIQNELIKINDCNEIRISKILINQNSNFILFSGIHINPEMNNEIPKSGIISFKINDIEYSYEYQNSDVSKKGDKINFMLDLKFTHTNLPPKTLFTVNEIYEFIYIGSTVDKEKTNKITIKYNSEQNISFKQFDNNLIFEKDHNLEFANYKLYHPNTLLNKNIINQIKICLSSSESNQKNKVENFIKKLGITYLFENDNISINYGIIIYSNHTFFKIYSFQKESISEYYIKSFEQQEFSIYEIIIFEENGLINKAKNYEKTQKLFFDSEIININSIRKEGFIKFNNKKQMYDSDYFFVFQNCNFLPSIGDKVRFLPSKNPSTNHINQPVAINISKTELPICIITEYSKNMNQQIYGKAVDSNNGELLFFSFKSNMLNYINNSEDFLCGDNFEYTIIKEAENEYLKLIKLLKKINKT